jgi:hypothetical protein
LIILTTVTLSGSNNTLPDDGDCTETCWSCFNVNFNVNFEIVFKTIHLCISWWIKKNFDNIFSHSLWFICAAEKVLKDINHHKTVPTATSSPLCAV